MKITYIVNQFPKLSETFILAQITGLIDRGHDVEIISIAKPTENTVHEDIENYNLLEKTHYISKSPSFLGFRADEELIFSLIFTDILHAHFAASPAAWSLEISKTFGVPFVITTHAYDIYINPDVEGLKEKFENWELSIDVDGYKKEIPAIIELINKDLKINISQTGMGISQVLPLIIRAFKPCKEETLVIIEEPESHLHPYAHAQVAQLFFESLLIDKNKKYLIETHSQNFVLRMRRLVAEGKIKPDDLAIYYVDFDEEKNESSIERINVDTSGGVDKWPHNVFGEAVIEARAIMNANINDLRNVD